MFQSTHPHGVRRQARCWRYHVIQFQSTHPHGVRLPSARCWRRRMVFQSTHPHGVRPVSRTETTLLCMFQSTHPHGVRHQRHQRLKHLRPFQSTHPHGVRHTYDFVIQHLQNRFNPRTRMGCDTADGRTLDGLTEVSIHAPAWGATLLVYALRILSVFQSTHPHGVRHSNDVFFKLCKGFNPRTRMGCDARADVGSPGRLCFNPRTRMGCDDSWHMVGVRAVAVSIHAPAWGATPQGHNLAGCHRFQSTHPHGVRPAGSHTHPARLHVSIHAPAWGATRFWTGQRSIGMVSIHAPAWGATWSWLPYIMMRMFQSTHPHGVRPKRKSKRQ